MNAVDEPVIRERIPVYDAHILERTDPRTGEVVSTTKVDRDRLQKIADKRNALIERSGDEAVLFVKHGRRGENKTVCGTADKFEVGSHEHDGRPTLYARLKFDPTTTIDGKDYTAADLMKLYPRRSVEIWLDDDDLDGVALLGSETPARYLGLLRMSADADQGVNVKEAPMDLQSFIAALMDLCDKAMGGAPDAAPGAAPAAAPAPTQYQAGPAGGGSGTGAMVPEFEKVRMQRDQDAARLHQLEEREKVREAEVRELKTQYRRERRENDIRQDDAEGIVIADWGKELELVTGMDDAVYEAHRSNRKTNYARRGTAGRSFIETARVMEGGGKHEMTAEERNRIVSYASSRGLSFGEAKKELGVA